MNILVLDVGTSSMRGTVLEETAKPRWKGQIQYGPTYGENGRVEQSPADWLRALREICASAASEHAVGAVALTAQRSSVIPLGAEGTPTRDAVMWQDTRNREVCEARKDRDDRVRALCGAGINTVFSGGKMAWLREHEPDIYERARKLAVIPDFLIREMTGELVTDHTYGSRSLLMDIRSRQWSKELLDLFGVTEDKLCRLVLPSSVAGYVTESFSRRTGLPAGIPVITCGGDQQCAALGQGITGPGKAAVNLGTGAYLIAATDAVPKEIPRGMICNASAIPEQYILEASVLTCGAAADWFLPDRDYSMIGRALRESPAGARGVLALPYFQGRSAPDWNSAAHAGFFGLSLETGRLDMLRALLEGVAVEVSRSLEQLEALQPVHEISLSGGLSRTTEIRQLIADVTGRTVLYAGDDEATTRGAWMSAAHCMGVVSDWETAWETACPQERLVYTPDRALTEFYKHQADRMEAFYQAVREL